jgi:hypothetical protein
MLTTVYILFLMETPKAQYIFLEYLASRKGGVRHEMSASRDIKISILAILV